MLILSGAKVVLPSGETRDSSILIQGDRIADVRARPAPAPGAGDERLDLHGHLIVPGFIDGHVHGVEGRDIQDGGDALRFVATRLARYGVTSFCPTTVACDPSALRAVFDAVREARATPLPGAARVLPVHLESNFINPEYRGAQPAEMLRVPGCACARLEPAAADGSHTGSFDAADILAEIERARDAVGILTVAPELDGGLELIQSAVAAGHRVSLGHSGATLEVGLQALAAGASRATHLFNRMPPLGHRQPGLAAAVIGDGRAATEIICDGRHVHPAMIRLVVQAKGLDRVMAITDGTAGSGLQEGARAVLGGHAITVRDGAAYLDDGTLAGSALTFDAAFRVLVERVGLSPAEASRLSSTTPARELGLSDRGLVARGFLADLVILDPALRVAWTVVGGVLVRGRG